MKKKRIIFSILFTLLCLLSSCNNSNNPPSNEENPPIIENKRPKISFDTNGGTVIETIEVDENGKLQLPENPTKEGYTFIGWYTNKELTSQVNLYVHVFQNDAVLYAKWEENKLSILIGNAVTENEEYYGSLVGLLGDELKLALHQLLESTHKITLTYSQAWDVLVEADKGEGNTIECIYTGIYINKNDRVGSSSATIKWNREHVWPNSKGFKDKSYTAYSDCFHLFASEEKINSTRGNKDFGDFELLGIKYSSKDEYGNFWNSDYFEPRDEVKGDIARAVLYLAVRYDGDTCSKCSLDLELIVGDSDKYTNVIGKEGYLGDILTLIKWHYEDPVSEDEMARNEVVSKYQGNRNPFIDHPEFVYGLYEEYAKNYITE